MRAIFGDRRSAKTHKQRDPAFHRYVNRGRTHSTAQIEQRMRKLVKLTVGHTNNDIPFRQRSLEEYNKPVRHITQMIRPKHGASQALRIREVLKVDACTQNTE